MVYIFEIRSRTGGTTRTVRIPAHSREEAWWHAGRHCRDHEWAVLIKATARTIGGEVIPTLPAYMRPQPTATPAEMADLAQWLEDHK